MKDREIIFICPFTTGAQSDEIVLPISVIVGPLGVYKNYGGREKDYFSVLPHRKWGKCFSDKIIVRDS